MRTLHAGCLWLWKEVLWTTSGFSGPSHSKLKRFYRNSQKSIFIQEVVSNLNKLGDGDKKCWGGVMLVWGVTRLGQGGIRVNDFGLFSTKLGGTVRAIKKWPRMTTDPVWAGITEKRTFLRSAEKCFFGQKWALTQKISQNFIRDWYLFGKRQLFSLNNFFRSWPEHGELEKVSAFFWAQNLSYWPEYPIFAIRP